MSDTRLMSSNNTRGWYFATRVWICRPTSCALTKNSRPSGRRISKPSKVSSSPCSGDSGRSTSSPRLRPMTYTRGYADWLARPIIDTMIATTMPLRVPSSRTPMQATRAQRNSIVRTLRMARNSDGLINPTE